ARVRAGKGSERAAVRRDEPRLLKAARHELLVAALDLLRRIETRQAPAGRGIEEPGDVLAGVGRDADRRWRGRGRGRGGRRGPPPQVLFRFARLLVGRGAATRDERDGDPESKRAFDHGGTRLTSLRRRRMSPKRITAGIPLCVEPTDGARPAQS